MTNALHACALPCPGGRYLRRGRLELDERRPDVNPNRRALGPGDHDEAVVLEVSIGARWGPTVASVALPGPGLPLPAIEADLDTRLMGVHEGQLRQQFRLIPRDDDEAPFHGVGPHLGPRGTTHTSPALGGRTLRQHVTRGKHKTTIPTDPGRPNCCSGGEGVHRASDRGGVTDCVGSRLSKHYERRGDNPDARSALLS